LKLLHSNIIGDSGRDLLILHGFLGMSDNWKTHAKNWSSLGFRVHLIDQRNHGRSFWSTAFSYDLMADDIAHYCETHQLQEVLILGHSMGGKTAMFLACKYPHLLKAIVIADIAPKKYAPHHQKILQGLSDLDFNQIKSRTGADIFLSSYVTEPGVRMFLLKNLYWVEPGKLGLRINIEVLKDASDAIGKNLSDDAQSLLPCLFVKGELSDYILESDTLLIKHYFTNAEQVTIAEAGHWLHAEKPKLFFDTVTDWLTLQI
jgi:pimeloyl-ACP methyl ester carboxylesterase